MRPRGVVTWGLALLLGALFTQQGALRGVVHMARAGEPGSSVAYDLAGRPRVPLPARADRPNVIVVLIDTLRADALERRTGEEADMPFLARFAAEHVRFTQASSPSPWTLPALSSVLTSRLPGRQRSPGTGGADPILAETPTLAGILRNALGYQTSAMLGGFSSGTVAAFGRGFAGVQDGFELQRAPQLLSRWRAGRRPEQPFHLLLHTFEAHDPYGAANHPPSATFSVGGRREISPEALAALDALGESPSAAELTRRSLLSDGQRTVLHNHPRYRAAKAEVMRYLWDGLSREPLDGLAEELHGAYRAGLRWVDGLLAELVAWLRAQGLLENTLLVISSDHGEAFGEHGMLLHGRQLYDELLRVPLVLAGPPPFDQPRVITSSVGTIDLFPTLLDWLGAPPPPDADGRSFLPLLSGSSGGRPVVAEEVRSASQTAGASVAVLASARDERWKYVVTYDVTRGRVREEAYDLRVDPGERHDLALPDGTLPPEPAPGTDGSAVGLAWDAAFCRAVEQARDRVWAAAPAPGGMGGRTSLPPRPAPRRPTSR